MTGMSPLLQNKLNNTRNNSDAPIQTKSRVKPNEAKAKIVNENILQSAVSAVKDTGKDCVNFVNILKTGKTSDHNLGRLNDVGLKAGALLIASFLALHAKTKTLAIKHFIGGATFLASMTLWPKIFINLPARLVHGFRIDKKYISSQGDKKDFGLDNQYYVWDAVPEKDLRKAAQKTGIDYDQTNGKEKTQRKIQKTILQNRTLNMATVGFATPLMTALFGNAIDPYVKKGVINHEFKKVKNALNANENPADYIANLKTASCDIRNVDEIKKLFKEYSSKSYDDSFFEQLAKYMELNVNGDFKNKDVIKPIKNAHPFKLKEALKDLWEQEAGFDKEALIKILKDDEYKEIDMDTFISDDIIKKITDLIDDSTDTKKLNSILQENGYCENIAKEIVSKTPKIHQSKEAFENTILEYNKNVISSIRTKLKEYLKLMTPVVGEAEESVYTASINKTLDDILKELNLPYTTKQDSKLAKIAKKLHIPYKPKNDVPTAMTLKGFKGEATEEDVKQALSKILSSKIEKAPYGSDEYKALIKRLYSEPLGDDVKEVVSKLSDSALIDAIKPKDGIKALDEAILGGDSKGSITDLLMSFIKSENSNIDAIKTRAIICANFEARLKQEGEGSMKEAFKQLTGNETTVEKLVEFAKEIVYRDGMSYRNTNLNMQNKELYPKLMDIIFDKEQFSTEEEVVGGIKEIVGRLAELKNSPPPQESKKIVGMVGILSNRAKEIFNNKTWLKTFAPMAAVLVGVTLLVQPLFGKIDNEFPEEEIKGGVK